MKGYYGHKNLWDEILLIGVINWIFSNYDLKELKIITPTPDWLKSWLDRNQHIINTDLSNIQFCKRYPFFAKNTIHFWGGGEVLTDQRLFPFDWWLYAIKYFFVVLFQDFVLLWGIGKIRKKRTRILYDFLLPRAKKIVVREEKSFNIAQKYNWNVALYRDFALDVFEAGLEKQHKNGSNKEKLSEAGLENEQYSLINWNPYIKNKTDWKKLFEFVKNSDCLVYFVPGDIAEDLWIYQILKLHYPNLQIYDRTKYNIDEIISFFANAECWLWTRLHFLLLLKFLNKQYQSISYQDKIDKLI